MTQERECADWRDRAARLQHGYEVMLEELKEAKAKMAAQEERIKRLEEALRGMLSKEMTYRRENWEEVRQARAALAPEVTEEG